MKKLTVFASLCVLLYSCYPTHPCMDSNLIPAFSGFSNPDNFTSIIFRAYKKGDGFNQIMDTVLIHDTFGKGGPAPGDTIYSWLNGDYTSQHHFLVLGPDFDWEIYVPAIKRLFHISEIVNRRTEGKGRYCVNEITSCSVDGETTIPVFIDTIGYPTGFIVGIKNK